MSTKLRAQCAPASCFILAAIMLTAPPGRHATAGSFSSPARIYVPLKSDWRFIKADPAAAMMPTLDDSSWRTVGVPHDWSIEGPFGPQYASGNGFAPGGIGWYRKHFRLDESQRGKFVEAEFDGIYERSEVYLNGFLVGGRPYGYSGFRCALTPYVRFGPEDNVLAVRVDHSRYADSRWYTGSGIYRKSRLLIVDKMHIAADGVFITTPEIDATAATVQVEISVENAGADARSFTIQSEIIGQDGSVLGRASSAGTIEPDAKLELAQKIPLPRPLIWSIETPTLYSLKTSLIIGTTIVDDLSTTFGVRKIHFDAARGFSLNGEAVKLKGVCLHHDAGCLGAAVPEKVLERRLRLLKELGVNAIRTSHNPPAPELLDLCDRLGFLVMEEAFDEFTPAKNKWVEGWNVGVPSRWGYADSFERWALADIRDMVRRDRNHPSVIIWSIGNEIDYPNDPFSHPVLGDRYRPFNPPARDLVRLGRPLADAVKSLDPTRPVTAALASQAMSDAVGFADILDIVGYNYQEALYPAVHENHPGRVIFGSENGDQYANWVVVRDNDYVAGQFLWTGIDYRGESARWPVLGNFAGLLDVCGFKKPAGWFRQSLWSDVPMVYLGVSASRDPEGGPGRIEEHWNWPAGSIVAVTGYTNCQEVRLTLNGQPAGNRRLAEAKDGALAWDIPFEPGVLKAVGLNRGVATCEYVLKTAGEASRIELSADAPRLRANGEDICQVEFAITDAQGVHVVGAPNRLTFQIDGPAELLGIDDGTLTDPVDYRGLEQRAPRGRGLAILRSTKAAGEITMTVSSPGLQTATLVLISR